MKQRCDRKISRSNGHWAGISLHNGEPVSDCGFRYCLATWRSGRKMSKVAGFGEGGRRVVVRHPAWSIHTQRKENIFCCILNYIHLFTPLAEDKIELSTKYLQGFNGFIEEKCS